MDVSFAEVLAFLKAYTAELGGAAAMVVLLVEAVFKPIRGLLGWRKAKPEPPPALPIQTDISPPAPPAQPGAVTEAMTPTLGMVERLHARIETQVRDFGLKEGMVHALARRYAEGNPEDFDQALRGIEHALEVAHRQQERGALPSNLPDAVDEVMRQVRALNEAGELTQGLQRLEREVQARADEAERQQAAQVRLCEEGVTQAVLARDADAACRFELARLSLEASGDAAERFEALRRVRREWYERGRDQGLNFDLEVAIALAEAALALARDSNERGTAGNDLSIALTVLGERESGTERLEEAVRAYRAALEEWTRERVPLNWAMTQNNLGAALQALGERESGTERLEEAVRAYRAAREEWTRERVPLNWAMTQNNLGAALRALGERESGTERLEEAVRAYLAALEERTRERVPLDWAMTQNNLGAALQVRGNRESGTERLEEAVRAYRAALEERTRERVPLDWATTQMNLGVAQATLFEKTGERAALEEALACFALAEPVFAEASPYIAEKLAQNKARAEALRDG